MTDKAKIRKLNLERIREEYTKLVGEEEFPIEIQVFAFDMPYKHLDAPNLCGLVFPKEDYSIVSRIMSMYPLNKVENPEHYLGVDLGFEKPSDVLELCLCNVDKSPIKLLYDGKCYTTTKKKILSKDSFFSPSGMIITCNSAEDTLEDISSPGIDALRSMKEGIKELIEKDDKD